MLATELYTIMNDSAQCAPHVMSTKYSITRTVHIGLIDVKFSLHISGFFFYLTTPLVAAIL